MNNLGDKRKSYEKGEMSRENLSTHPMAQFDLWYRDAEKMGIDEPNAMTIATATATGQPSARIVLLKGFDTDGFAFYTNYTSRKGQDLTENPQAALVFFWKEMERQVRVEGNVEKLPQDVSLSYFHSRPRGSQISAWASPQSQEIKEHYLADKRKETESRFSDQEIIPIPHFWGGFIVKPAVIEFWQGKANRYHDRFRYQLSDNNSWSIKRVAP